MSRSTAAGAPRVAPNGVLHIVYPSLIADPRRTGRLHPPRPPRTRARRLLPPIPPPRVAPCDRHADLPLGRPHGRGEDEDVRGPGGGGLVRRRAGRQDLPEALLPGGDPVAAGGRARLLEREGGHPPRARICPAGQARPRAVRRTAPHIDDLDIGGPGWADGNRPGDGDETSAAGDVDTSGPSSVPIPLLILGGLALLLLAAGGAGYLSRRAQARRNGGPPGPA